MGAIPLGLIPAGISALTGLFDLFGSKKKEKKQEAQTQQMLDSAPRFNTQQNALMGSTTSPMQGLLNYSMMDMLFGQMAESAGLDFGDQFQGMYDQYITPEMAFQGFGQQMPNQMMGGMGGGMNPQISGMLGMGGGYGVPQQMAGGGGMNPQMSALNAMAGIGKGAPQGMPSQMGGGGGSMRRMMMDGGGRSR